MTNPCLRQADAIGGQYHLSQLKEILENALDFPDISYCLVNFGMGQSQLLLTLYLIKNIIIVE